MDKATFVGIGTTTRESKCNLFVVADGRGSNILAGWLSKTLARWSLNEVVIPELPVVTQRIKIQKRRETGRLECIYHVQPESFPYGFFWVGSKGIPFTKSSENYIGEKKSIILKSENILNRPDIMLGDAITELGSYEDNATLNNKILRGYISVIYIEWKFWSTEIFDRSWSISCP